MRRIPVAWSAWTRSTATATGSCTTRGSGLDTPLGTLHHGWWPSDGRVLGGAERIETGTHVQISFALRSPPRVHLVRYPETLGSNEPPGERMLTMRTIQT